MDDATRAEIESRLIDEIAESEEKIIELEKLVQPVAPDNALGRLTRMEALNDKAVNEAALGQARERLYLLESALTRVYEKGFGICTACEKQIPLERLLLMPQSTRCVECAAG